MLLLSYVLFIIFDAPDTVSGLFYSRHSDGYITGCTAGVWIPEKAGYTTGFFLYAYKILLVKKLVCFLTGIYYRGECNRVFFC